MLEPKELVLDNEFVTIWCYPKQGIIHHQFHRYVFGDRLREALIKATEAFARHGCSKWLSDDRHFGALLPEDKAWGDTVWRPKILGASWKYWAMVLPDKTTGKMNIKKLVDEYQGLGVSTRVHDTPEEALQWLCDQE